MPRPAVIDFANYARQRRGRLSAATQDAERSQAIYERIVSRASDARRREFMRALERGLTVNELAEAVRLEADEVEAIVNRTSGRPPWADGHG